jgi:hypothetical protein
MTQIASPIRHNVVKVRSGLHPPSDASSTLSTEQYKDSFSFCALLNVLAFVVIVAIVNEWFFSGLGGGDHYYYQSMASCDQRGTSTPNVETIAIAPVTVREYETIHEHQYRKLQHHFASYITGGHTVHDYSFLAYLAETYGDCRPLLQVGDANTAITLALSSSSSSSSTRTVSVQVFDPTTRNRWPGGRSAPGIRGRNVQWTRKLLAHQLDVTQITEDLNNASVDLFRNHMLVSWLIVVSGVQRTFVQRLIDTHAFSGLVVIDQIHTGGAEMRHWWSELLAQGGGGGSGEDAAAHHYRAYDVTSIAHASGTGLLDFSHRVHLMVGNGAGGDDQKQVAIVAS